MNQIEPSDFTTTSLGELRRLPSKRSARTRRVPSCSMRETQRVRCSHETSRPCRSTVWPLWLSAGCEEDRDRAVRFVVAQHAVVGDVGPDEVFAGREVGRALRPSGNRNAELFETNVVERQLGETIVEDLDFRRIHALPPASLRRRRAGAASYGSAFAVGRQRRALARRITPPRRPARSDAAAALGAALGRRPASAESILSR